MVHEIPAADVFSLRLKRCGKRGHAYAKFTPRSQRGAKRRAISTSLGRHYKRPLSQRTRSGHTMQFVTPTKAADPLDGLPPPPSSPRPEPKWIAWPPSRLPQRPKTFTAVKGSSGLVICVGLNKDGSYVAFDGHCYHMGEPLFDACGAGDIEDDGSVRCPAHGRRVSSTTGACAERGPFAQRTYRTRVRQTAEGVVVDVDVSRPGSFASDAYNGGCPSSVERRRRACAAIERVTPDRHVRRRLAYDDDDEEMAAS